MANIEFEQDGTVAVIRMNNGKNVQNLAFAQAMDAMLDQVIEDDGIKALVIASTDVKNWSQGLDLEWIAASGKTAMRTGLKSFFSCWTRYTASSCCCRCHP